MNNEQGKTATVCITGATDGIGKELAAQYLQQGYQGRSVQLILIGRRALSDLDPTFFNEENYCRVDLVEPTCASTVEAWLQSRQIDHLDLLIHNAGAGYVGLVEEQEASSIDTLLQVNLQAPIALTHGLLPKMYKGGKIVFVSSVASVLPTPEYAVYSATKAALDGLARNLRTEFNAPQSQHKIEVQLIHPGATKTQMHNKSGADLEAMKWEKFPSVESVTTKIRQAINGKKFINPVGWQNGLFRTLGRHMGTVIDPLMARQFQKKYPLLASPIVGEGQTDPLLTSPIVGEGQTDPLLASPIVGEGPAPRRAVITGAADGIGKALARRLLEDGWFVTGVDFDQERAAATQAELDKEGGRLHFIFGDLSSLTDVEGIGTKIAAGSPIDLMIHNAGISAVGHFADIEVDRQQQVVDVNLRAPLLLSASTLANQLMRPGGTFIFMSSLSYFAGYPGAAVYGASKDGLASFARSLRTALAGKNINVLTVFPGPTRTAHARRYSPDNSREEKRMSPDELAERILAAVEKRKKSLVPGMGNRISAVAGTYFPRVMDWAMRKVILEKLPRP